MLFISACIMLLTLTLKRTSGDSVTQSQGPLVIKEGASLVINCTYDYSSYPYLFWYIQHSGNRNTPQLLLKDGGTGNTQNRKDGFSAHHIKTEKSFHLRKEASKMRDSSTYFCAFGDTVVETAGRLNKNQQLGEMTQGIHISQAKASVTVLEGKPVSLECSYEASGLPDLFWYEQHLDEGPQLLLSSQGDKDVEKRMHRRKFRVDQNGEGSFHLTTDSSELRDSAFYFCALSDTVVKTRRRAQQKLTKWQSVELFLKTLSQYAVQ